jgi:murein DD-endopeptidase MepM/ murein hydrolase activator NlpD
MRPSVFLPIRPGLRFAALGALALSASACSQTDRFAYDPFSNPFNGKESPSYTGSVGSAPTGGVSSQPLPPPGGYQQQPASYTAAPYTAAPAYAPQPQRTYPPYQQSANYQKPMAPPAPLPEYKYTPKTGWNAQGGQTVIVKAGDTPFGLGTRYGVPASAIIQANKLPPGATLTPGQRVVIPAYNGQQSAAAKPVAPQRMAEQPHPIRVANGGSHTVKPGETLFSIARNYSITATDLAQANEVGLDYRVRIGEKIQLPGGARTTPAVHLQSAPEEAKVIKPVYKPEEDAPKAIPVTAAPQLREREPDAPAASASSGGTDFRWPVRGRVISAFGAKPNGQTNDGVNISVPEGTEIKAAEGGVVAYAGNELKGFGNLILIRHAGEWVTAYAHASEILVKRGDVVRRGQLIAKAGKSGNVSAPQLHFEVRRGASPVDPMDYLPQG